MTREEAIEFGNMWLQINDDSKDSNTYAFFQMAIKALEQEPVLDKIRIEIKKEIDRDDHADEYCDGYYDGMRNALAIIDKYKAGD